MQLEGREIQVRVDFRVQLELLDSLDHLDNQADKEVREVLAFLGDKVNILYVFWLQFQI